jgi:hypothetical protein
MSKQAAPRHRGTIVLLLFAALMIVALPAMAAKGGGGKGHGGGGGGGGGTTTGGCTAGAPRVSIDNTWAWGSWGAWGMPGQTLSYAINVGNNDLGCGSSTFVVDLTAATGFSVSIATNTISLASASSGYVWANVTSPSGAADGNYPLVASVQRAGTSGSAVASETSYYKVYSTDTVAPKLYWMNPSDGGTLSGSSTYVGFSSSDDHAVKRLDLTLDGVSVGSKLCDNISYDCQISYKWSIGRVSGQHTATYTSTDWMGNVSTQTANFTVN